MKRFLVVAIMIFLSFGLCAKETIKIGYFENKPHIYTDGNKTVGVLAEFWETVLSPKMNVDIEWVGPLPPTRLFLMLDSGEINCIALLSKNSERAEKYDYPEFPFQKVTGGIAILKERNISKIDSLSMISGMSLTFFKEGFIHENVKKLDIPWDFLTSVTWKTQGMEKTLVKRVDGVYEPDITTLQYVINHEPRYAAKIIAVEIPDVNSANYSVFTKKDAGKFLKLYNPIIKTEASSYKTMLDKAITN